MVFRELKLEEITSDTLSGFERYEEINKAWRIENGILCLKAIHYTEDWDEAELAEVCEGLRRTLLQGGAVFAALNKNCTVGFASLEHEFFGKSRQYIQLSMLHITKPCRNMGIGKQLFRLCADKAREFGAKKLYISASSCENGQYFYSKMGCVPAIEIDSELYALEPYDCQLEFVL